MGLMAHPLLIKCTQSHGTLCQNVNLIDIFLVLECIFKVMKSFVNSPKYFQ